MGLHGFLHDVTGQSITEKKLVEVFAGSCRLSRAVAAFGILAESFERERDLSEAAQHTQPPVRKPQQKTELSQK